MAKLTRCPAGHVFDADAHSSCPECARLGVNHTAPAQEAAGEPSPRATSSAVGASKSAIPFSPVVVVGAAAVVLAIVGYFALGGSSRAISDPAAAQSDADYAACVKPTRALTDCERAIASERFAGPALGALYRYRGFVRSHSDKPDTGAAIADYTKAIELEPVGDAPYPLRSGVYMDTGRYDLAIKDLDKAIANAPRWDFYSNRGLAHMQSQQPDLAIADFDAAIKLKSDVFQPYWNRGLLWQGKKEWAKAAADFKKALSLDPPSGARKQIEALLKSLPPARNAETHEEKAVRPEEPSVPNPAARPPAPQEEKRGEATPPKDVPSDEKKKVLQTEEEILADPDFKACSSGTPTQVADCDRAIASGKFDDEIKGLLYDLRGGANLRIKAFAQAIEDFTKAITLSPSSAKYYGHRASARYGNHEDADAVADYNKAIEIDPKQWINYYGRGLANYRRDMPADAASDFKKALELEPDKRTRATLEEMLKRIAAGEKFPSADGNAAPKQDTNNVPPAVPAAPDKANFRTGIYLYRVNDGKGNISKGMAAIVREGETVKVHLVMGPDKITAKGSIAGRELKLKYSDGLHATFVAQPDGSFGGAVEKATGFENFIPFALPSAGDGGDAAVREGSYAVSGKTPDGKNSTTGTAYITREGKAYRLAFAYSDGQTWSTTGTLISGLLLVFAEKKADWRATAFYALLPDGRLSGLYTAGNAQEMLTPSGGSASGQH